jgi:hypothetical protein
MVFVEGDDYRQLRRPGDDPAQFRSVVRPAQVPVAPDSVIHQYRGQNFTTSGWRDSVGDADMSINGVSASTLNGARAASSDGVDDFGLADGPQDLPQNETFGFSMVINDSTPQDNADVFGAGGGNNNFQVIDTDFNDGTLGELFINLTDGNGNAIAIETKADAIDGDTHLVVFSKRGGSVSDLTVYIDDMTTPVSADTVANAPFDHTKYSNADDMAFFAENTPSGVRRFNEATLAFVEFNEEPYSPLERQALKRRVDAIPTV